MAEYVEADQTKVNHKHIDDWIGMTFWICFMGQKCRVNYLLLLVATQECDLTDVVSGHNNRQPCVWIDYKSHTGYFWLLSRRDVCHDSSIQYFVKAILAVSHGNSSLLITREKPLTVQGHACDWPRMSSHHVTIACYRIPSIEASV